MNDVVQHAADMRPPEEPATCWSCGAAVAPHALFCGDCRAVQPPRALDHFSRLGLAVEFQLDHDELDRVYFALQRQLHPDRFATKSARERAISQSQAVSLNEAYRILKDPLARADYMLKLKGIAANPDGCHTISDPTILMEQMERREALLAAESSDDIAAIAHEAQSHVDESVAAIAAAFHREDLVAAGRETTRLKYLVKLLEEARGRKRRFIVEAMPGIAV